MKDKKWKYYEDGIGEYLQLIDEVLEIPTLIEMNKEKLDILISGISGTTLKPGEANNSYKLFWKES